MVRWIGSRDARFPGETVSGGWINVFDRLDPVCGFDPELANDFRKNGAATAVVLHRDVLDAWRHSITKYLRQS
jgi:hypothetical protein